MQPATTFCPVTLSKGHIATSSAVEIGADDDRVCRFLKVTGVFKKNGHVTFDKVIDEAGVTKSYGTSDMGFGKIFLEFELCWLISLLY